MDILNIVLIVKIPRNLAKKSAVNFYFVKNLKTHICAYIYRSRPW